MNQQDTRRTFTYQLLPAPEQARTMATVVWHCRERCTAGLHERTATWEQCRICVTFAMQSAHLPASAAVRPDSRDRSAQVAKRISDAGWAALRTLLTSEAAYAGKWVIVVPAP
jgi:hypothetical protein